MADKPVKIPVSESGLITRSITPRLVGQAGGVHEMPSWPIGHHLRVCLYLGDSHQMTKVRGRARQGPRSHWFRQCLRQRTASSVSARREAW
jgi:hypothetical protein